jgi:S-adenosylmethionine hydrolase
LQAELVLPYQDTFSGVAPGEPLLYLNSLGNVALAINQGDFAAQFGIASGPKWSIRIEKDSRE